MTGSGEFDSFREWMNNNPREWTKRAIAEMSVPRDFRHTLGHDITPIYARFLKEVGPLDLIGYDPDMGYMYSLLTPVEIQQAFNEHIVCWNKPEDNWDFGYLMPFCRELTWGGHHCFDLRFSGEDDLPVVLFDPAVAIPDHEIKVAASFKYWLEKIVKFGDPIRDSNED